MKLGPRVWIAGALAVLVAGAVLIAKLIDDDDPGKRDRGSSSTSLPHDGDAEAGENARPGVVAAPQPAIDVAMGFVRAWVNPAGTREQWHQRVTQYTEPALSQQLSETDPENVPARKVLGDGEGYAPNPTSAVVAVRTDAGNVVVTCIAVDGGWRVASFYLRSGR